MVASVSPSCTSTEDHKASSSSFNQQAMVFAAAVTAAVISQAFIFIIFLKLYYDIICKSRAGETKSSALFLFISLQSRLTVFAFILFQTVASGCKYPCALPLREA